MLVGAVEPGTGDLVAARERLDLSTLGFQDRNAVDSTTWSATTGTNPASPKPPPILK
jgi:hypothetical protein